MHAVWGSELNQDDKVLSNVGTSWFEKPIGGGRDRLRTRCMCCRAIRTNARTPCLKPVCGCNDGRASARWDSHKVNPVTCHMSEEVLF